MKTKLVEILACPACGGELRLTSFATTEERDEHQERVTDTEDGILTCNCGRVYPIIQGVPRLLEGALGGSKDFLSKWDKDLRECGALTEKSLQAPSKEFSSLIEPTLKRFEKEWSEHNIEEHTWGLNQETRLDHSLRYLGMTRDEVKGKLVLDAGAGTGQLTCSMATLGCEIVGIDLSPAVIRGWKSRAIYAGERKTHVHIVQGNLMRPPFRHHVFDGVMSNGVLHHTPNTRQAFDAVAPVVRPGGTLGVWLYKKDVDLYLPLLPFIRSRRIALSIPWLRRSTPKWPPTLLYAVLVVYASFFRAFYAINTLLRGRQHDQTIKGHVTSLFDTLAPPYVWRHTPEEVAKWFERQGYKNIRDTTEPGDLYGFCVTAERGA